MELIEKQAYTATPNIPVKPNQCYVTTTPSVDPEQLRATVEGQQQSTAHDTAHGGSSKLHFPHTSQQQDYDYVIPYLLYFEVRILSIYIYIYIYIYYIMILQSDWSIGGQYEAILPCNTAFS